MLRDEGRKEDGVPNSGDSILSSTDGGADRGQLATLGWPPPDDCGQLGAQACVGGVLVGIETCGLGSRS